MPGIRSKESGDYSAQEVADYLADNPLTSGAEILDYLKEQGFELAKSSGGLGDEPAALELSEGPPEEGFDEAPEDKGPHLTIVELRQKAAENAFKGEKDEEPEEEAEVG
jgi:hypothetical protein